MDRREKDWTVEQWRQYLDHTMWAQFKGKNLGDEVMGNIAEALKENSTVREMMLQENQIGDAGASKLAGAIMMNSFMSVIRLDGNKIGVDGASRIAEALMINSYVTHIYFNYNKIGAQGAKKFAEALNTNATVTNIDLERNNIGPQGGSKIADALKVNSTVIFVGLSGNNLGDEGAGKVADALKVNSTVMVIRLANNNIGVQGAIKIAEALQVNSSVTNIDIDENKFGEEGARKIAEALRVNPVLKTLYGVELRKYLQVLGLPEEFSKSENTTILAYLRELKFSTPSEICRMRVMIVGPGDAGKTTLVQRLMTDEFSARQFSMTDGVSIKEWKPTSEMKISLWDFGGQQVYLNTHAMLFSDKTLYLLLWNPRVGTDPRLLEEYLLNVRSRSKTSPIMLVTTHGSEVDKQESERWLPMLSKHNYLSYHNVDSSTGLGIAELRQSIVKFVSEDCAKHSLVLVPGWYAVLELKLKELSMSKFSIERAEFRTLCSSLWRSSSENQGKQEDVNIDSSLDREFLQAARTVLSVFHHWGVVFVLKKISSVSEASPHENEIGDEECGDIVLNPQSLADVFKCVITCHAKSTSAVKKRELFEEGILRHNLSEIIWSGYEPRLCSQFLRLLHDSELCYEIFDSTGVSTHCSLVPSLLPVSDGLDEMTLRDQLFDNSSSSSTPNKMVISQGSVKISFDCLLPNFFPKLMVRLRHLSSPSPAHISRLHFVVHLAEWDADEKVARSSWVCVVQDPESRSLLLYPGGCSFGATGICNTVIRELLKESFSGMAVRDVTLSADDEVFSKKKILSHFDISDSPPILTLDSGMEILLSFLSPLLGELDGSVVNSNFALHSDENEIKVSADEGDTSIRATLRDDLSKFEKFHDLRDKFDLGHSLIQNIPLFRHHGLGLPRSPNILWLVGRSSSASSASMKSYLYAVSPSVTPSLPWEIVPHSEILLSVPSSVIQTSPHASSSLEASLHVDSPSRFLFRCLSHFIPHSSWPGHISEWSLCFLEGMVRGNEREAILTEVRQKEATLFVPHLDMFGAEVLYWRELLERQRGQSSMQEQLERLMAMMASYHTEVTSNQHMMMTQLDRVEGSISKLTEQLSGVLMDIREELLLQAETSSNEEALADLREMWEIRMDNLERVIESSSENVDAMIRREMKGLELKLVSKLCQLEVDVNPERVVTELTKVREELIAANRGRLEGDEASVKKLNQLLSEMRGLQSQLDRVEEKMTQFFGNLTQSLNCVQQELLAKGNSEGLKELRELWVGRMGELEDLIRSQSSDMKTRKESDAAIEKMMKKMDAMLSEKMFDFELSIDNLTPQLTEMKQQLLGVVAGVREGDQQSQKRMDSMLLELKGLQTQFVEVIRLQNDLSLNLNEGLSALKNCVVNVNTRSCPTTFVLVPIPPQDSEIARKGMVGHMCGLYKAIRAGNLRDLLLDKYRIALICEACRCPSEDEDSWYEVREPREIVGKILPLARAGLQFASGVNKVSSLGRILGLPTPVLEDSSFAAGLEFLDDLEQGDLSEYVELQRLTQERNSLSSSSTSPVARAGSLSMGEAGYCIREFSAFLSRVDPKKRWSRLSSRVNEKGDLCFVCPSCCSAP